MKEFFSGIGIAIVAVLLVLTLGSIIDVSSIFWQSKIGVWREDVRRNNFEHTKSYNQGKIEDLAKYFHEYNTSDKIGKVSIKSVVRVQFADYNADLIQDDQLRLFVEECRK